MRLVPDRPRYVVLCNFDEFWVYDFETQIDAPVDTVALAELPDRYGPLAFLFPDQPNAHLRQRPRGRHPRGRRQAGRLLQQARRPRRRPRTRPALHPADARRPLRRGHRPAATSTSSPSLLDDCTSPADSLRPARRPVRGHEHARAARRRAVQGRAPTSTAASSPSPPALELHDDELVQLRKAAKADWSKVRPEIFGTLFQHSMDDDERHAFGAHFTTPSTS